jgi:cell division protein FtsI/penicillin-binding protein 2
MVFVGQKLGKNKLVDYIGAFGFGKPTNIDLEGEETVKLRSKWGDIDVATATFVQGIAVNTLQMLMAVAAIANEGKLMEPHVVQAVIDGNTTVDISHKLVRQVISKEAAQMVTNMMVTTAKDGEAKWAIPPEYMIAGKTGTAQIPIAGHYDAEKTMASFVGFAPASDPKFVMIVKLNSPQTSTWASETAAPLWVSIAKLIFHYFNLSSTPGVN